MYKIDFNRPIKIHFMGIGGISMSGLAEVLLERGFSITGSDMKSSPITEKLENHEMCIRDRHMAHDIFSENPDSDRWNQPYPYTRNCSLP